MRLEELPGSDAWVFLAATGGGAGAQDRLWSVPGASSFFAGAVFPYAQRELEAFIGYEPLKYVSVDTAISMAIAAYMRACLSCPEGKTPIGVGTTASLATLQDHRGAHMAWTAAISGRGRVHIACDEYEKGGPIRRVPDGMAVDDMIEDVLLDAAQEGMGGKSADDLLISHVFKRPWFRVGGRRELAPISNIELLPGAFNPLHAGHLEISNPNTIFQLSLRTPHKPAVSITEALRRTALINAAWRDVLIELEASTFLAKARKWPGSTFIIGSDTLQRILDPKYGHPIEPMLEEFHQLRTKFLVSQRMGDPDTRDIVHFNGPWPKWSRMFSHVGTGRHAGLSSTQLRAAK